MRRTLGPVGQAGDRTYRTRRTANHRNQVTAAHRAGGYSYGNRREILREYATARGPRSAHEHLRGAEAADSGREGSVTSRQTGALVAGQQPARSPLAPAPRARTWMKESSPQKPQNSCAGRVARGDRPPGSHRTERDSLPSLRSSP